MEPASNTYISFDGARKPTLAVSESSIPDRLTFPALFLIFNCACKFASPFAKVAMID